MLIDNFEATVNLGYSKEEQSLPQPVRISVKILFAKKVAAEHTDLLQDAIDYVSICEKINQTATSKTFHLIEHMAFACMESLRPLLVQFSGSLSVSVQKIRVPVKQLQGGVHWTCHTQF